MVGQSLKSRLGRAIRRLQGQVAMAVGRAGSTVPLSKNFGFERGKPIDRHYIETFLASHRADIRGHVLEVADDGYSRRFGSGISAQDILSLDAGNARATLVGDLAIGEVLPAKRFDCVILTQTLQFIFDIEGAVAHVLQSLKPGGVLLVTAPGITPIDHNEWHWSLTGDSLQRLLEPHCDQVSVEVYGNLFAATAFLHGAAVEETGVRRLDRFDPAYPVIIAARAVAR